MVRSVESKHVMYFEAIMQLREVSPQVLEFAFEEIQRAGVHIAKKVKAKKGLDLYLSDNDFARALGRKLQLQFGGNCQITASIYGRKDGKEIYRTTVLFRGINFRKGDMVEYKGDQYNVKALGKEMLLQDAKTGRKVHVKYKEMKLVKKAE